MDYRSTAAHLLQGAYDLHVHASPSHDARSVTDWDVLMDAEKAGMAGVLIKNHYEPTGGRAESVNHIFNGTARLYGGIALNLPVGGINPYAVESAVRLGARMIWMPTRDAKNSIERAGRGVFRPHPGISVLDKSGNLIPSVYEVLEIAKQYQVCVSTGHLSLHESWEICRAGKEVGVQMILTHPEYDHTRISVEDQLLFVREGVMIEKDWVDIALRMASVEEVAGSIRKIGAAHIYLATDRGQASGEKPVEGMLLFLEDLLRCGITEEELVIMIQENPRNVLQGGCMKR